MLSNISNESKNQNKNKPQLKTTYSFIKGIPSASNWSNHFTSLIFPGGKYLLYISNSFIIILDLFQKKFNQILSSNKIFPKDKPNIIMILNNERFLCVLNSGEIIIFYLNNEGIFVEDLNTNKFDKVCHKTKCGVFDKEGNILIISNEDKIEAYFLEYNKHYNINKLYEINEKEYFIMDMILIKNESNNYFGVCNNIGNIIIYKYDTIKYEQILKINSQKKENIYNIIFDKSTNLLFSINKSGTLNIYEINLNQNIPVKYTNIISLSNKFNDKTINEFYLYFTISFIQENNSSYILITSNQGRIFLYNIKKNEYKEIAENPHKNSIYTILLNNEQNKIIFFSSDYKISLFDLKYKDNKEPSIRFLTCINTIPSKIKLLKQCSNKIFFLYQIQHQLYINSYDIKKEINTLDTLQNKIRIKYNNKENSKFNYNLSLCKLIDEERLLLINKKNEIIIYNIENEEVEYNYLFLTNEEIIINILFEENVLYILYKSGKIIIYNIITKKIEKYKISNEIDKGSLMHLKDNIIIIIIKENKSELVQFYLLKNYIYVKLNEIIVPNLFYSNHYIFSNFNFFYFYAFDDTLKIFYMNFIYQYEIVKEKNLKEINYETYLEIINNLQNSRLYLNEKNYEFSALLQRSDVNKNNLSITNIVINEYFNMICSFSDGSIMYYILDIDKKNQKNYIINKIIYKYLIKVNFLLINDVLFINNISNIEKNNFNFVTVSAEQSLKITDPSNCNILNINFFPNNGKNNSLNKNYIINRSFTNIFSNYFFSQSIKDAKKFSENFFLPENINNTSIELLIYSYFNNEEKNLLSIQKIIEYAINKTKNKKQNVEYIEEICDYFSNKGNINNKLIFYLEEDNDIIIDCLIENYCYVECLIYIKYKNLGMNIFINCLEKIKKSIYIKQLFQASKIEKIIQYYKNNFNIIYE